MRTELYFASGVSQLNSTGTFVLSRAGQVVTIIGTTVNLRWFDPYNWNPGSSAWIPGHGMVSDDVGLDLKDAGRGHDFSLFGKNLHTTHGRWLRSSSDWAVNRISFLVVHSPYDIKSVVASQREVHVDARHAEGIVEVPDRAWSPLEGGLLTDRCQRLCHARNVG